MLWEMQDGVGGRGFVYLIRCDTFHQVGWATKPLVKLTALQSASPHPMTLLGTIAGTATDAAVWHTQFDAARGIGDWFSLAPEQVAEFTSTDGFVPFADQPLPARPARRQVEYTIDRAVIDRMKTVADLNGHSVSRLTEAALHAFDVPPAPPLSWAQRSRLRIWLPEHAVTLVNDRAERHRCAARRLIEGTLRAALAADAPPARGPGWDPNSAVR